MKMFKRFHFAMLITMALAFSIPAYGGLATPASAKNANAACKSMTSVNIGISPFQDTLLPTTGQALGWYKKACLNVSFTNVAWDSMMTTLASRSIDVAVYNTTGVVATYHADPNLVFAYPWDIFDQGAAMMGRPHDKLKTYAQFRAKGLSVKAARTATMKQLKGRTVVTTLGTDMGEDLIMALHRASMKQSDVHIVNLDTDAGLAAFLHGTGDAYIGGIPQRTKLVAEHYLTLLAGPNLTAPPLNGFVMSRQYFNSHKTAILSLIHVTYMIIRYTQAHTKAVGKYITSTLNKMTGAGMTVNDFVAFWQHWEHYPLNAAQAQKQLFSPKGFGYWHNIWHQDNTYLVTYSHLLKKPVPTSAFLGVGVQKSYVKKYGANEKGWWKPTGHL